LLTSSAEHQQQQRLQEDQQIPKPQLQAELQHHEAEIAPSPFSQTTLIEQIGGEKQEGATFRKVIGFSPAHLNRSHNSVTTSDPNTPTQSRLSSSFSFVEGDEINEEGSPAQGYESPRSDSQGSELFGKRRRSHTTILNSNSHRNRSSTVTDYPVPAWKYIGSYDDRSSSDAERERTNKTKDKKKNKKEKKEKSKEKKNFEIGHVFFIFEQQNLSHNSDQCFFNKSSQRFGQRHHSFGYGFF